MSDILKDLQDEMARRRGAFIRAPARRKRNQDTYILLNRAYGEIERLRKANSDMGWQLNPDRMGGQFTEEEKNRSGWI
jgi:hypothetical protein